MTCKFLSLPNDCLGVIAEQLISRTVDLVRFMQSSKRIYKLVCNNTHLRKILQDAQDVSTIISLIMIHSSASFRYEATHLFNLINTSEWNKSNIPYCISPRARCNVCLDRASIHEFIQTLLTTKTPCALVSSLVPGKRADLDVLAKPGLGKETNFDKLRLWATKLNDVLYIYRMKRFLPPGLVSQPQVLINLMFWHCANIDLPLGKYEPLLHKYSDLTFSVKCRRFNDKLKFTFLLNGLNCSLTYGPEGARLWGWPAHVL